MGGRLAPEWVAGINRNQWPAWSGISGRHGAEYAVYNVFTAMHAVTQGFALYLTACTAGDNKYENNQ
jgi:hypothetical protein